MNDIKGKYVAMSPVGRGSGLENLLPVKGSGFESLSWRFRCIAVMVAERLAKSSCRNAVQVRSLYAPFPKREYTSHIPYSCLLLRRSESAVWFLVCHNQGFPSLKLLLHGDYDC